MAQSFWVSDSSGKETVLVFVAIQSEGSFEGARFGSGSTGLVVCVFFWCLFFLMQAKQNTLLGFP